MHPPSHACPPPSKCREGLKLVCVAVAFAVDLASCFPFTRQPGGLSQKTETQTFPSSPLAIGPPSSCLKKKAKAKARLRSLGESSHRGVKGQRGPLEGDKVG